MLLKTRSLIQPVKELPASAEATPKSMDVTKGIPPSGSSLETRPSSTDN